MTTTETMMTTEHSTTIQGVGNRLALLNKKCTVLNY